MPDFTPINTLRDIPRFAPESAGWHDAEKFNSRGQVIRGYRLVAKKECPYFLPYRVARFFLGALATVCSAGCLYCHSKTIRKLVTKSSETVRFGIADGSKKKSSSSKKSRSSLKSKNSSSASASSKTHQSRSSSSSKGDVSIPSRCKPSFISSEEKGSVEFNVVVQPKWERLKIPEASLASSRTHLQEGMVFSEPAATKIKASMDRINRRENGDGFRFFTSQSQHRVFTLDSEPGLIFKYGIHRGRMAQRLENIIYVNAVREHFNLDSIIIPHVMLVNIGSEQQPIELLVEEKLEFNPFQSALSELYLTESRRLDMAITQLSLLIHYTGLSDVEPRNCPPILSPDPSLPHKIALIDLQSLKQPRDGLYGGDYSGRGLIRTISTQFAPKFAKISAVLTKNFSDKSFQRAISQRRIELQERERLLEYYQSKGIERGDEPLPVNQETLDFSRKYSPKQAERIHQYAIHLIRALNQKMHQSSPLEAVSARRKARIHTTQGHFKGLDQRFIDEKKFPEGTQVTEKNYRETYLGCIIDQFVETGAIHRLIKRGDKGYLIQA